MKTNHSIGRLFVGIAVCLCGFSSCQAPVGEEKTPAGHPATKKKRDPHPISMKKGDRRIRHDFEEWSIWAEGEKPKGGTAKTQVYNDPAASAKGVGGLVFKEVENDQDRQWVSYPFYISSTFFRYGYDVFVRYATKDMGIDCEFIYQEGTKYEGPKKPIMLKRGTLPCAGWRAPPRRRSPSSPCSSHYPARPSRSSSRSAGSRSPR